MSGGDGDRQPRRGDDAWRVMELALGLGIRLALPLAAGIGGGAVLDRQLGSSPILLAIGTLLGAGLTFYLLYNLTKRC